MTPPSPDPLEEPFDWHACIQAARAGSASALGRLLQACRTHLLGIAERELDGDLRAKTSPSDLVQETFLDGSRAFSRFIGGTEGEVRAWLCRVLRNNLADLRDRFHETAKRDVGREESLEGGTVDRDAALVQDAPSPSSLARRCEEAERVEAALAALPEAHRRVIYLRHRQHLSFPDVARAMNRSLHAVHKLWSQAIQNLRDALRESGS